MNQSNLTVPATMKKRYDDIIKFTDEYCKSYLDEEYAQLTKKATATLCRKRPSPLATGNVKTIAAAIVYALGQVNFLFDKSKKPYVSTDDFANWFELSKSTIQSKAKFIRDALKIRIFDHTWMLNSLIEQSSTIWLLQVNGFIVDIREMPLEAQIQAYDKGLIPYVPIFQDK